MHPWFKDFDWQAFENQTMPAPYIPKVKLLALLAISVAVWLVRLYMEQRRVCVSLVLSAMLTVLCFCWLSELALAIEEQQQLLWL